MIDKILFPLMESAGIALAKGGSILWNAITQHFSKHGTKYVAGAGGVAVAGGAYAVGEAVGHNKGKKEGTAEQAARDEKKMNDLHQQHENDRKRWNEEKQEYEDLLDEVENQ